MYFSRKCQAERTRIYDAEHVLTVVVNTASQTSSQCTVGAIRSFFLALVTQIASALSYTHTQRLGPLFALHSCKMEGLWEGKIKDFSKKKKFTRESRWIMEIVYRIIHRNVDYNSVKPL